MKKNTSFSIARITGLCLFAGLLLLCSCQKKSELLNEQQAMGIDEYIRGLQYDPDVLLNVQSTGTNEIQREQTAEEDLGSSVSGGYNVSCKRVSYNLKENFEDIAILRPTNGVVFPGALVVGNAEMLDGNPTPLQVDRAPVKLRLDLPGIADAGNIMVNDPENGSVQAAIDNGLDYWNNEVAPKGYSIATNVSYKAATSFSSKQLALEVGLNVEWAGNSVATEFSHTSTETSKVAMMVYKQAFYTVTMNTPASPSQVFGNGVTLEKVKSLIDGDAPAAYVSSVVYGRIIMFRMESSYSASADEIKVALEYAAGVSNVDANTAVRMQNILSHSTISMVLIGGNAAVTTEAVSAKNFGDLQPLLKGENATYGKSNPGVPIAYTIRYLKDNRIAKMGYTTDYKVEQCERQLVPGARLRLTNNGWFDVRFYVEFTSADGKRSGNTHESKKIMLGMEDSFDLPAGAHDIVFTVKYSNGSSYKTLKTFNYAIPVQRCFQTSGDLLFNGPQVKTVNCN